MIKGTTSSGFEFEISDRIRNDFRFIRAFKKSKSKDADEQVSGLYELIETVVGSESELERLCDHVAEEDGYIPADKLYTEITEMIKIASEENDTVKNS